MKKVRTEDLQPGMKVAKTVFSLKGSVLLHAGVELKQRYIERLGDLNIPAIYVVDEKLGPIDIPEPVSTQTRIAAMKRIEDFSRSLLKGNTADPQPVKEAVYSIIDEILADPQAIINLKDIRSFDDYTFAHSVQVAILSLLTAVELDLNQYAMYELGMGAMLHDIGKLKIDEEILNKPDKLSTEEFALIKKHPRFGFDMLRKNEGIKLLSAHIAFQHHERINGTGYPRALADGEIHLYGKIAAVTDVYDAMTADRVYKRGVAPHEAIRVIRRLSRYQFDPEIVEAFLKHIAVYPIGTSVQLNNNFRGLVVDVNRDHMQRPIVRLTETADGQKVDEFCEVDLSKERKLEIVEVIEQS